LQVTHNRSLDGVLDQLNSKHMTDAGPLQLIAHEDADSDDELLPAGGDPAAAADVPGTATRKRAVARTRALALSPTGATWAAATTEGLLLYALDAGLNFDPTDLTEALTPQAFHAALAGRAYVRALLIALRLGDPVLLKHGLMSVPPQQVTTAAAQLPPLFLQALLSCVAECLDDTPHMEYLLSWVKALLVAHGPALAAAAGGGTALRAALAGGGDVGAAAGAAAGRAGAAGGSSNLAAALRALRQVVTRLHKDLSSTAEGNVYLLDYIVSAGQLQQQRRHAEEQQQKQEENGGAEDMQVDAAAAVAGGLEEAVAAKTAGKKQKKPKKQQVH
jgi:periodic tryptophan protein 2